MDAILVEFFRHNTWANLRLLDACATLSDTQLDAGAPGTFGRIRDTLVHLIAAQERYLVLLTGELRANPLTESMGFPGFSGLRERAQRSSEELVAVAGRIAPAQILRGTRHGEAYAIPASVVLIQAINHATEHRGHVATILSQVGIDPPVMDAWTYSEEGGSA